ncbi:hypothetical protein [Pseudomonas viridiflava]|uniref:hypothetical protein n=1 Tax=Pseudomonas viridiflava TaxID=33069 RepID=UPI000F01BEA4|nr:hypothetical protein [Pseudomonas viridiflava]
MPLTAERFLSGLVCLATVVFICVGTTLLIVPERAEAEPENQVTCVNGVHIAKWSPGLTNTRKPVDITTKSYWGPCESPSSYLSFSASAEQRFQADLSCPRLRNLASPITWVINWDDRTTSTYVFNTALQEVEDKGSVVVGTGYIVDGRYQGARAVTVFVLGDIDSMIDGDCASPAGLVRMSGRSVLVIE